MRRRILITAGPTREPMDPVRFLSNPSSGAMGIALAETLAARGVRVELVLGPTALRPSRRIKVFSVTTALEMAASVKKRVLRADAFIATAAVGDWRFSTVARKKLKKGAAKTMTVKLVRNPDILAAAKAPLKIGFALETGDLERNGLQKLREKNCDLLIANAPASFTSDRIRPAWIEKSGSVKRLPAMTKKSLARKIAQWLERQWKKPR